MKEEKIYSEKKPIIKSGIEWKADEKGIVTLKIKNSGLIKRILKVPEICYIHLDETGSFIWQKIDGKKNIYEIGADLKENFHEKAEPIMARLKKFFQILKNYKLIEWI